MSTPTPLQSFLGGLGLSLPVHALLMLNGAVFGVSGFIHRAVRGDVEAAYAVAGMVLGGAAVGKLEGIRPQVESISLGLTALSGLLVGIGSKLGGGCTSGHMIAGISRFSPRSIVATAMFFLTGVSTTHILYRNSFQPPSNANWSLKNNSMSLFALHLTPLAISALLYLTQDGPQTREERHPIESEKPKSIRRRLVNLATAFSFAIALSYSNLTVPNKVTSFLAFPFHRAFDPSLVYLAIGVLPLTSLLYHYDGAWRHKPLLGGKWNVPTNGKIDARLVLGAAMFGIGWGISGICPGPGLVNAGLGLATGRDLSCISTWLGSFVLGSFLADQY